ncbi:MAG: hypothetical protein WC223_00875 [Bacteroidales bacterium]|jgi:hypothetical protein
MKINYRNIFRYSDYRWLLAIGILAYFAVVIYNIIAWNDYARTWEGWLNISPERPGFADFRSIAKACEIFRNRHYSIFTDFNSMSLGFGYPKIWFLLSYLGIKESHTNIISIIFITLFFIAIFKIIEKIGFVESLFYFITITSFPFILAIERANADLIIFLLLFLSFLFFKKNKIFLSVFNIILSVFLKYYTIFTLVVFADKKKSFVKILMISFLAFGIYSYLFFSDISFMLNMKNKYYNSIWHSYGMFIYVDYIKLFISNSLAIHNKAEYLYLLKYFHGISLFVVILIFLSVFYFSIKNKNSSAFKSPYINEFRIGTSVYIGSFFLGYNFDYRLIFLIFTLPQIFYWIKHEKKLKFICLIILTSILVSFNYYYFAVDYFLLFKWNRIFSFNVLLFTLRELSLWVMFSLYLYIIVITMPENIKEKIILFNK